jgi:hypothetical protein
MRLALKATKGSSARTTLCTSLMRHSGALKRISSARGMLRCSDKVTSQIRGVSEWVPIDLQIDVVNHLRSAGYDVL